MADFRWTDKWNRMPNRKHLMGAHEQLAQTAQFYSRNSTLYINISIDISVWRECIEYSLFIERESRPNGSNLSGLHVFNSSINPDGRETDKSQIFWHSLFGPIDIAFHLIYSLGFIKGSLRIYLQLEKWPWNKVFAPSFFFSTNQCIFLRNRVFIHILLNK